MKDRSISQEKVNQLIGDVAYLKDEAEAMQYVIDSVPYTQKTPDSRSISELLLLIDHAQTSYYRPVFEDAVKNSHLTHLEDFTHFEESFDPDKEHIEQVQKTLGKIAKHRAGLVNQLKNISLLDWEALVYENKEQILIFHFMRGMINFERKILASIANQVKIFNQEKKNQREMQQRRSQHEGKK